MAIVAPTVTAVPFVDGYSGTRSFTFDAPPDTPGDTVTYVGAIDADADGALASGVTFSSLAIGAHTFHVKAVETDGVGASSESDVATLPFSVLADPSAPSAGAVLIGTASATGWYRALSIQRSPCADPESGLPAGACDTQPWTQQGSFAAGSPAYTIQNLQGMSATAPLPSIVNFDSVAPSAPALTGPGPLVPDQPTFKWTPATDVGPAGVATSGVDHYDVQAQPDETFDSGAWQTLASVKDTGGVGDYSAAPSLYANTPLPEGTLLDWRIVAVDGAGNVKASSNTGQKVTIDPTIPPKPTIVSGPSAPSQNTSPTFTWDGNGKSFAWKVTPVGSLNAVRSGAGVEKEATLRSLGDGTYVFHVTQFTPADRESEEASQTFTIDTTPPEPPTILTRPTFPAITAPVFTWSTEAGAYSRWLVIGPSGTIIGPIDTPVTSAELPPLADGAYSFQVQQIDAAGNVSSATSEPFTVLAPLVPDPSARSTSGAGTISALALPRQNATRLQPKAGKVLPTLVPVLRWARGPRGTKLYNLQIFKVTQVKKAGAGAKVTKIYSSFPKGLQARAPKRKLAAGTCYVWRIWPYTGRAFTPKPVGVSNFCTASAKVIRAKARAAKVKAAKLRSAAKARR